MSLARKSELVARKGFGPRTVPMNRGSGTLARGGLGHGPWRASRAKKASRPEAISTEQADALFSLEVRERDGWRCSRCREDFFYRRQLLDCSHFFNVRFFATRYVKANAIALCKRCHTGPDGFEYSKKTAYRDFMIALLGAAQFEMLRLKSLTHVKLSDAKLEYVNSRGGKS